MKALQVPLYGHIERPLGLGPRRAFVYLVDVISISNLGGRSQVPRLTDCTAPFFFGVITVQSGCNKVEAGGV